MSWPNTFFEKADMARECCDNEEIRINSDHFWNFVQQTKKNDYFYKPSNRLMFEKTIYLNNEYNVRSILSIGFDPENEFAVAARLEVRKTGTELMMDAQHIKSLLEYLEKFENNILNVTPINKCGKEYKFSMHLHRSRVLEMSMRGWSINIDEESLQILCRMRTHIQYYINLYEKEKKNHEHKFFKVLEHFFHGKKLVDVYGLAESYKNKYTFFNYMILHHKLCLNEKFIHELVTNFMDWFATCVPCYAKALMLNEAARLKSFSLGWPHTRQSMAKYICVETMAKTGLYYTGSLDNVACAFCDVNMFKWKSGDNPILDHHKYKPNCPFLINHQNTLNVPVGNAKNRKELKKMLSILPEPNQSIDEVDADCV